MTQIAHAAVDDQALRALEALVRGRCGMVFKHSRRDSFLQAVEDAQARFRCASPRALLVYFQSGSEGKQALEQFTLALTVGETYFWRNRPQFEALEKVIVPELVGRIRDPQRLNVWSAACSTGEEAYSLAILFHKAAGLQSNPAVQIVGTDLNPTALAAAREALYPSWSFRDTPPDFQERYFSPAGTRWQLKPELRSAVTFRLLNLMSPETWSAAGIEKMDLILCRNVLIYFDSAGAERVIRALYETLNDGGWLILGHADTFQLASQLFAVEALPHAIVYQKRLYQRPAERKPAFPQQAYPKRVGEMPEPQGPRAVPAAPVASSGGSDPLAGARTGTAALGTRSSGNAVTGERHSGAGSSHGPGRTTADLAGRTVGALGRAPRTTLTLIDMPAPVPRASVRQTLVPGIQPPAPSTWGVAPTGMEHTARAPQASARLEPILTSLRARQADEGLTRLAALGAREKLTSDEMCQVAEALADQHLLDQAEAWCSRAIAQDSQNARGYYLLGLVRASRGQLDSAIQALRKAIYLRPEYPLAHLALSDALSRAGEGPRARKELELVLDQLGQTPDHAIVPESNGLTVRQLRTLVEARQRL